MVRVLGVDLASKGWLQNGTALIELDPVNGVVRSIKAPAIAWPALDFSANALARCIHELIRSEGVCAVALDGPQGWRDPSTPVNAPGVGRRCEREARTQGKTGIHPRTYPSTQRAWIEHCVKVFDALVALPGMVLARSVSLAINAESCWVLECYPTSTWRAAGLKPLPAKGKHPNLSMYFKDLCGAFSLPVTPPPGSHDDLQAVVGALAAMAATGGPAIPIARGVPPLDVVHLDGTTRRVEGLIFDALPLGSAIPMPVKHLGSLDADASSSSPRACMRVTSKVLEQVQRSTGSNWQGQMQIVLHGFPSGTRDDRKRQAFTFEGRDYSLWIGDTSVAWHSHQDSSTRDDFEALFGRLAEAPDTNHLVLLA